MAKGRSKTLFRKLCLAGGAAGVAFSLLIGPAACPAQAMSSPVRAMLTTSLYGAAAGTVVGLVSWPFTRDARSVFMGSSVGLYLGIVVGVYYLLERDDPGNPLRPGAGEMDNAEAGSSWRLRAEVRGSGPGSLSDSMTPATSMSPWRPAAFESAPLRVSFVVLSY